MLTNAQPLPLDRGSSVSAEIASFVERAAALIEVDRNASGRLLRQAVALLRTRRAAVRARESPRARVLEPERAKREQRQVISPVS